MKSSSYKRLFITFSIFLYVFLFLWASGYFELISHIRHHKAKVDCNSPSWISQPDPFHYRGLGQAKVKRFFDHSKELALEMAKSDLANNIASALIHSYKKSLVSDPSISSFDEAKATAAVRSLIEKKARGFERREWTNKCKRLYYIKLLYYKDFAHNDIHKAAEGLPDGAIKKILYQGTDQLITDQREAQNLFWINQANKKVGDNPKNIESYLFRASLYRDLKQYQQAIADYSKAIELDPQNANTWSLRGYANYTFAYYDLAIQDYSQAIKLDSSSAATNHFDRGLCYNEAGNYEKAISDYSESIRRKPNWQATYYERGRAHYLNRQYQQALLVEIAWHHIQRLRFGVYVYFGF